MIVFFGRRDDSPLAMAIEAAEQSGTEHLVLDMAQFDRHDLLVEIGSDGCDGRMIVAGQSILLDAINGIYARPLEFSRGWRSALGRARSQAFLQIFLEWLDFAPAVVVNRPSAMETNSSKPLQAQLIAAAGFRVPETLVTNDPAEARAFWDHHRRVVFKSVSGVRSIVQELLASNASCLERIRNLPTQFQAFVPGTDVRVHVVGKRTFAAEIRSPAIDYRYAAQAGVEAELTAIDLADEIRVRCSRLARNLDLAFCGIDLRRLPDGEFVCFEVNPMPAYSYYETHTGLPISRALLHLLAGMAKGD